MHPRPLPAGGSSLKDGELVIASEGPLSPVFPEAKSQGAVLPRARERERQLFASRTTPCRLPLSGLLGEMESASPCASHSSPPTLGTCTRSEVGLQQGLPELTDYSSGTGRSSPGPPLSATPVTAAPPLPYLPLGSVGLILVTLHPIHSPPTWQAPASFWTESCLPQTSRLSPTLTSSRLLLRPGALTWAAH